MPIDAHRNEQVAENRYIDGPLIQWLASPCPSYRQRRDGRGFGSQDGLAQRGRIPSRLSNTCNSSAAHPPSGPIASANDCASGRASRISPSCASRSDSAKTIRNSAVKSSAAASLTGSAISGGATRRDCSEASRAMRRQRSTRFAAAKARCFSVRRAITGTIVVTFNSVHFSIAHSMRSNLNTANSSVIGAAATSRDFLAKHELHPLLRDTGHGCAPHYLAARHFKLLPHARPQRARQMCRVIASQRGAVIRNFIGNPAASGHRVQQQQAYGDRNGSIHAAKIAVLAGQSFFVKDAAVQQELERRHRAHQQRHHQPAFLRQRRTQ